MISSTLVFIGRISANARMTISRSVIIPMTCEASLMTGTEPILCFFITREAFKTVSLAVIASIPSVINCFTFMNRTPYLIYLYLVCAITGVLSHLLVHLFRKCKSFNKERGRDKNQILFSPGVRSLLISLNFRERIS